MFNLDDKLKLPYFHEYIVYALEKFLQEKFSLLSKRLKLAAAIWISYNFQRGNYSRKYSIRVQCKHKKSDKIKGFSFIHSFIHSFCVKCTADSTFYTSLFNHISNYPLRSHLMLFTSTFTFIQSFAALSLFSYYTGKVSQVAFFLFQQQL